MTYPPNPDSTRERQLVRDNMRVIYRELTVNNHETCDNFAGAEPHWTSVRFMSDGSSVTTFCDGDTYTAAPRITAEIADRLNVRHRVGSR